MGTVIILGVLVVLGVTVISIYNNLIQKRNQVDNVFAGIDALLKKRYDLIPNLIATVKEYMTHEQKTLTDIAALRAQATTRQDLDQNQKVDLENKFMPAMRSLMIAVENYPNLKANENFLQLQGSFNEIEEQISAARRAFNATVTDYNNTVQMFPGNIFAGIFGFGTRKLFEISDDERKNPNAAELFKR